MSWNIFRYALAVCMLLAGIVFSLGSLMIVFSGRGENLFMTSAIQLGGVLLWLGSYFVVATLRYGRVFRDLVLIGLLAGSFELLHFVMSWVVGEGAYGIGSKKELFTSFFFGSLSLVCVIAFRAYLRYWGSRPPTS
jgi:hypothetical protein